MTIASLNVNRKGPGRLRCTFGFLDGDKSSHRHWRPVTDGTLASVGKAWYSVLLVPAATSSRALQRKGSLLMNPTKSKNERALEEDLASLEAQIARVAALSTTSDQDRANLAERLRRLKKKLRTP